MSLNPINNSELEKARNNREIIKQTAEQVQKDFGMFGLEIDFSGNIEHAYPELFNQLQQQLNKMLTSNTEKLRALLYQIDLSESKIKKELNYRSEADYAAILADMILQREMKKVILRMHFSGKL